MTSTIKICMGSSCFARGNSKNLQIIQNFIEKNHLDAEIQLTGLRCCNNCSKGPNITIDDTELVDAFLDMAEKHKMIVENAGLLTIAALNHLDCKDKNVVSILSGGNMHVITMSSLIQHGLINRGRIFTFSVQLPDRPGELLRVAEIIARENGNIIKLDHNQFININRQSGVELKVTLEAFGLDHKRRILEAMKEAGYDVHEVGTADFYD